MDEQIGIAFWCQCIFFSFPTIKQSSSFTKYLLYLDQFRTIILFISAESPSVGSVKAAELLPMAAHLANSYGLTYHKLTRLKMMSLRFEITHVPRNTFRVMARNMKRSLVLNLWKGINLRDMVARRRVREKAAMTLSMWIKKKYI